MLGFQAILRRKPSKINIPLFPAGQASWLLFGRTARINSTKKLCFRHRASLRQSKTSLKRYTSDSAVQTSASVRACAAPSGKRSDVQTEPRTRAARLRERSETLKLFSCLLSSLFPVPFVGLCYNSA